MKKIKKKSKKGRTPLKNILKRKENKKRSKNLQNKLLNEVYS